ncbi:hypothetical protein SKAU_G00224160 [Synaphobranchus kaupii]|uniref:Uncharacterized protein n=1 Tax=Synaphobranchus kaupii TaxID=118154 RepID=A0A9Q1FB91_SYNKA|nr:hypothetical protein SKAU_G00224160 [Synaphobranchus kaupii]
MAVRRRRDEGWLASASVIGSAEGSPRLYSVTNNSGSRAKWWTKEMRNTELLRPLEAPWALRCSCQG